MNVLLVRPRPPKGSIGLHSFMICEPLELEYLAAAAEKDGHSVTIVDMMLEKRGIAHFVRKHAPDVVGFTSYITHVGVVRGYAKKVKRLAPGIVTIVGGVHAEVNPRDFECDEIDLIVKANGIGTFRGILSALPGDIKAVRKNVPGVWDGDGKPYAVETAFDHPFPDRAKTGRYRNKYNYIYHSKCALIKTSFGCAYRCEFCYCAEITGGKYFERGLPDVIAEIKTIREKNVFIVDDNFLFKRERVLEFCRLLEENGIRKNFILFGRSDFINDNEDAIKALSRVGLQAVFVGIESFKREDLASYDKRTSVENNVKAVKILEANGVDCYSGIIAGMDWGADDFSSLAAWLNQFENPAMNLQPLTPMPGTKAYKKCRDRFIVKRSDFGNWDMAHVVMQPLRMTVSEFYMNIVKTYYESSAGVKAHVRVWKKYGPKVYLKVLFGTVFITLQYLGLVIRNICRKPGGKSA